MTGMRCIEHIIKSSYKRNPAVQHLMLEHTKQLMIHLYFINTKMIINTRLLPL